MSTNSDNSTQRIMTAPTASAVDGALGNAHAIPGRRVRSRAVLLGAALLVGLVGLTVIAIPNSGQRAIECQTLVECSKACSKDHMDSCDALGLMYRDAWSNVVRAAALFRKTCAAGSTAGCIELAGLYESGEGVPKDLGLAANSWQKAAEINEKKCASEDGDACWSLSAMLARGRGVPQDAAKAQEMTHKAMSLLEKDCSAGNPKGCVGLSAMLRAGPDAAKEDTRALDLLKKSCDAGYARGCLQTALRLGPSADLPNHPVRDYAAAVPYYERACEYGNLFACNEAGKMLSSDWPPEVPKDPKRAVNLFDKACSGGLVSGCFSLSILYHDGTGIDKDPVRAALYTERAWSFTEQECELDSASACDSPLISSFSEAYGERGAKLKKRASELHEANCNAGNGGECYTGGHQFLDGYGVPKDPEKGAKMLRRGCELGYEPACPSHSGGH